MIRHINRGYLVRSNLVRGLTTSSMPKDEHTFENEWDVALPYSKLPGPTAFQLVSRFLPGGKYHNLPLIQIHSKIRDEYGAICRLPGTFGRRDIVFSFDPKDFEKIYRSEGHWPERKGLDSFVYYRKKVRPDVFKNMGGLVSEQGQSWATLRHKVNPVMLQPKTVKSYIPQVDEIACEFLQLAKGTRDANNEMPATFGHDLNKWSLESIGAIALDQRLGVLMENNDDAKLLISSIKDFFRLSYELDVMPSLWHYVETPKFKKLMKTFDNLTDLILKYVDRGIAELEKKERGPHVVKEASVLEKLLKIDRHAAVVMAIDMLFAGVDTTSATAVGCLYHIAKNPDKQEKLRAEIRSILPSVDSKLTADSLTNIPYLRACFKEALRLSPVVAGGIRAAGQDIVLQGYQIPKGIDIAMAGALLQRDEEHYPQNSKFIPERWLKTTDDASHAQCPSARSTNPFIYLPFGFGARACIGRRFAEMEVEVLLARILREYKVEWNYPPIRYVTSLIQSPVGDLKFKLTEI